MASTISFAIKNPAEAERILDEFEERTGLEPELSDDDDRRVYPLSGDDHQVDVVQTLTDIDEDWAEHLAPESQG
jgi:hypothetical protein